jgi:hypothetical protein
VAEVGALVVGPPLEVARARHAEAVEERPHVPPGRRLEPPGFEVGLEELHIAHGRVGIEAQLVDAEHQLLGPEITAEGVERLVQRAPGHLGP